MVHQSSLRYKDLTLHHFVVSSICDRRARLINWKSVCLVLCCCVRLCQNLYRTKNIHGRNKFFVFILRKLLPNYTDYFEKLMVNILHRKIRVNDGYGVSKAVTSTQDKKKDEEYGKSRKKFEDVEL